VDHHLILLQKVSMDDNWTIRAKEIYSQGNLLLDISCNLDLSGSIITDSPQTNPVRYLRFRINGTEYKMPYYQ
jgi:hypothetical protein